jgi:phage gp29-like protein
MSWQDEALKRLDALIEAGQKLKNDGTYESTSLMTGWTTQAKSALHSILGRDHTYSQDFESNIDWKKGWRPLVEILNALRSDVVNGYLRTTANIISAEIFTDFLDMARHLLDHGADSDGSRPPFRDDLAHHSDLISLGVPR